MDLLTAFCLDYLADSVSLVCIISSMMNFDASTALLK